MARLKCPCCGKPYNGKKCKDCLYEVFAETEVHHHAHGTYGVPAAQTWKSVIRTEAQERKPVVSSAPRQASRRRSSNAGKRLLPIFLIPIICVVISLLFELVVGIFVLSDGLEGFFTEEVPAPEMPAERFTLYQADGITLFTPWQPNTPLEEDVPVYVENNSDQDVVIQSVMSSVNGIMAEDVFFYCEAKAGSIGAGTIWLAYEELGVETVGELVLYLEIFDAHTYIPTTAGIRLALYSGQVAQTTYPSTEGTVLMDQDSFRLVYQGRKINDWGEMELFFYGQNSTDHTVYVRSDSFLADGTAMDAHLWSCFLPQTQGWFSVTAGDPSKQAVPDLAEIGQISCTVYVDDYYDWESFHLEQFVEFTCDP